MRKELGKKIQKLNFCICKNNNLGTRQDVSFNNFKDLFDKFTKEFGRNERTLNVFYKSGLNIEAKIIGINPLEDGLSHKML